jgi:ATP-binding cassette subfamily B (MDR/TAP) protein 1
MEFKKRDIQIELGNQLIDGTKLNLVLNETEEYDSDCQKKNNPLKRNPTDSNLQFDPRKISFFELYSILSTKFDIFLTILAILGSIGAGMSVPLFSILIGRTLSEYGPKQNLGFSKEVLEVIVNNTFKDFFTVGSCIYFFYFLKMSLWTLIGRRQIHRLKKLYFKAILRQEQGWFDSNNVYEFSTKVQSQIKQIEGGVGEKIGSIILAFSQLLTGLIIAFTTSWKLTFAILVITPFTFFSARSSAQETRKAATSSRKAYEKAGGIAEEVLYNIKTVASFANFSYENNRYARLIDDCKNLGIKNGLRQSLGIGGINLFLVLSYSIAITYGSYLIAETEWNSNAGRPFLSGDISTVIMSIVSAASLVGSIAPNLKAISEACSASSDFFTLNERLPKIDLTRSFLKPEKDKLKGQITFENVSFSYPSRPELSVLRNFNIKFESGKKIAIVGESGSGKTTIISLLERMYDLNEGRICIDGIDIRDFDIKYLRNLIGVVQQEPVLFNASIKENIIFGRDISDVTNVDDFIYEACQDSYANEFIEKIENKYEYIVGVKGSKLSGGQKQRIAISRAILMKPKILILDEATSALDNRSQKQVQRALDRISEKKVTMIIIAHRLSTIKKADIIYAIKNGIVVEQGNHEDLLSHRGYYANLIKSQMLNDTQQTQDSLNLSQDKTQFTTNSICNLIRFTSDEKINLESNKQIDNIDHNQILAYLKENKSDIFSAIICSILNGFTFPLNGLFIAFSINLLSSPNKEDIHKDGILMGKMFVLLAIWTAFGMFFQNYKFTQIGEILTANLRKEVFSKYLRLPIAFFDRNENSPGALLTKLSLDTTQLNGIVLNAVGVSLQSLVCFWSGAIISCIYDWRISFICMAFFPFLIMASNMQHKLRRGLLSGDDDIDVEAGSIFSETVLNTRTIFSFNFQEKAIEMYLNVLEKSRKNFLKHSIMIGLLFGFGHFSTFMCMATTFYAAGYFISNETSSFERMTIPIIVLLYSAFNLGLLQQYIGDYARAKNAYNSIFSLLNIKSEIDTTEEANNHKISVSNIIGKIEFKNVTFAYPTRPDQPVLKNLSFTILPGQSVAFVGDSGSGKSTIIQLIERFYDVNEGQILIDGIDIRDYNLISLRKNIGLVLQEPCLFKRSVRDNIIYGKLNASNEEIVEAARNAHINKFFAENDQGTYENLVSGGEKQRLAIARSFLKNPKILLLDEATSALDRDSENQIHNTINRLKGGRTCITIAHRLNTIENADIIYVLENGIIVEHGTHETLYFNYKSKYYNLQNYSTDP